MFTFSEEEKKMQQQNRKWTVISVLALASILFAACAPQTVEVPVTVVVAGVPKQVTVVETQIVEVEKEAFTTPHPILGDIRVRRPSLTALTATS